MDDERNDERIVGYLRQRAEVPLPRDASQWAASKASASKRSFLSFGAAGGLAFSAVAIAIVLAGVYLVSFSTNLPVSPPKPSNAAFGSPTVRPSDEPRQSPVVGAPFPASVFGMPVVTIAEASSLAANGQLDGRDVAVAGWFYQGFPSCPLTARYTGPLEGTCVIAGFADSKDAVHICGTTSGCQLGVQPMTPRLMSDTLGSLDYNGDPPWPIVVVGHVNDPRQWQCLDRDQCARQFVADRLAWANGNDVLATANASISGNGQNLSPSLTLDQLASAVGSDRQIVSAGATDANGVRAYDPRWNETGQGIIWVVRSVPKAGGGQDSTRPVTVSLIDDSTGKVIDSRPLAQASGYDPARLWLTTIVHNPDPNYDNAIEAIDRVADQGGTALLDGRIGGGTASGGGVINIGPDLPLLLDPGIYSLTALLTPRDAGSTDSAIGQCSTQPTLNAGEDVVLSAVFPRSGNCTWSNEETPSFGLP
jgi:hypothetical protein